MVLVGIIFLIKILCDVKIKRKVFRIWVFFVFGMLS